VSILKRYDWTKVDRKRLLRWGLGYLAILLGLFGLEMAGVGNPMSGDTLTEFSTWLSHISPPVGAGILIFITWLPIHFWRRILPILLDRWRRRS